MFDSAQTAPRAAVSLIACPQKPVGCGVSGRVRCRTDARGLPGQSSMNHATNDGSNQDAAGIEIGALMTNQQDIDTLRQRIATAEGDCDLWRKAGPEEKFIEAYVIVKALELELDEKLCQPNR